MVAFEAVQAGRAVFVLVDATVIVEVVVASTVEDPHSP